MEPRNLVELHRYQAERLGPLPALRFRRHGLYHDYAWSEYRADALACAAALLDAGIQVGDRVGLLSENRVEWLVADMGLMTAGAVNVPPHAPLTGRQVQFQLADAGVRWLFVSTREQFEKVRPVLGELPQIEGVVLFDPVAPESGPPPVYRWDGFLQRGRQLLATHAAELARRETALTADDLATIMYTSGTTGNPKGVMLTHGNLLSNAIASVQASPFPADAMVLGWLPYSHIYARLCDHYKSMVAGVVLALAGSAETVVQDLEDVQPTHLASVPRLYEKVLTAVASDNAEKLARDLRKVFGRRIRWLGSGGAPLPAPVAEAYRAAGLLILQGYGLTESSPVISFNSPERNKANTVGPAIPGVEVKIALDGEVLTRGPHVMKGYWNNPQATAEAISDGWLHTGDLGKLDEEGFLSITGRKKELLVLSNGKKVVPSYLEGLLIGDPCIDQAVITGEGRNFLTALVVPHWDNVRQAASVEGVPEELARHPAVLRLLRARIDAALKDVSNYEQVRKFVVLPQALTVANDELTVSLKLRRQVVLQKHAALLESLYRE